MFLNLVAETLPQVSDAIPLLGRPLTLKSTQKQMKHFLFEFVKWKEMILNDDQICKYLNDKNLKKFFKLRHKISMQFHVTDLSFNEKMINPVEWF